MNNKKLLLFLSILLLIVVFVYLYLPCFFSSFFEGKTGYNKGISQSKNSGVFLSEYTIKDDEIALPGYYTLPIGEIWMEHAWTKGDCSKKAVITKPNNYSNYWLYIEIRNNEKEDANQFIKVIGKKIAILSVEGNSFSIRKIGEKNYLFSSYKNLPAKNERLTIIARNDSSKSEIVPQKWKNPKIIGTINLIAK